VVESHLKEKHVDDIWVLVRASKQKAPVPRVLLKIGKRSKSELSQSQARQVSKQPSTVLPNLPPVQKVSSDNGVLVSDSGPDSVQVLPGASGMPVDDVSVLTIDGMSTNAVATTTIVQV